MSEDTEICLIGSFAPDIAGLVQGWLVELGFWGKNDNADKRGSETEAALVGRIPAIPLIVCESRADLKRLGVLCPYEFVLERKDFLPVVEIKGKLGEERAEFKSNPRVELENRIKSLLKRHKDGLKVDELRDWFAGLFRRYICLDETVHGTSNLIDLDKLRNDSLPDDNPLLDDICLESPKTSAGKYFHARFGGASDSSDPLFKCRGLLESLFRQQIEEIKDAVKLNDADERRKKLVGIYEKCKSDYSDEDAFPRPLGDRAKYVTATGKIDVLVIDDKPNEIEGRINLWKGSETTKEKSLTLCDELFNFQQLKIDPNKHINIFEQARVAFENIPKLGLSFDLVLVDLCLGDETGGDLSGYRMIKFVKQFFPDVPVVVYSKFRDMDHIARAFECGAKWFVVKGEEDKLPRHVLRMLRQSGWHREWRAAQNHFAPVFLPSPESDASAFIRKFHREDKWKYLTYKCLEFYPGKFIRVKKMGGGISSAVTFKAVKGVQLDGEDLQSPVIVKIDSAHNATMEYECYFRYIRPYISNQVGRIDVPARILNRDTAAIVYSFAGHPDSAHALDSMANALSAAVRYESSCDYERFRATFDEVFDEILPRIHRITPAREFGSGDVIDCHSGVVEPEKPKLSSYPNPRLHEVSVREFYKSYLARMQPWWQIDMTDEMQFMLQPRYDENFNKIMNDESADSATSDSVPQASPDGQYFVFHGIFREGDQYVIEAYDKDGKLGWLNGLAADHVARYRRILSPGKTLWISKEPSREYRAVWLGKLLQDKDIRCLIDGVDEVPCECCKRLQCRGMTVDIQDDLIEIAKIVGEKLAGSKTWGERVRVMGCEFSSPVGIVHGDLNFGNIMMESRRQNPPQDRPDERWRTTDTWLIDFARTRRDLIAHDFNVAFTATLSLLVDGDLLKDNPTYRDSLVENFAKLVRLSFTDTSKNLADVPDAFRNAPRFAFVYRILRRIRFAALKAGVSEHMYLLTSALACAYTFKIFLNRKKYIETSAMLSAMKICYELLKKDIVDDELKGKLKYKEKK